MKLLFITTPKIFLHRCNLIFDLPLFPLLNFHCLILLTFAHLSAINSVG